MRLRILIKEEDIARRHVEFTGKGFLQGVNESWIAESGVNFFGTDYFHGEQGRVILLICGWYN